MKHSIDRKTKHHSLAKKPSGRALVNEPPSKWAVAPKIGRLNLFGAKDKGYHNIEPAALLRLFIEAPDCRISSHVERMNELVAWLQSVAELPPNLNLHPNPNLSLHPNP